MRHEIHQITQADSLGCAAACVAMVCGISYDYAKELCGGVDQSVTPDNITRAVVQAGFRPIWYVPAQLVPGRTYIIGVPSLNVIGGSHCVVVDWRDEERCVILDPAKGREGRHYYGLQDDGSFRQVLSYFDVMEVVHDAPQDEVNYADLLEFRDHKD